MNGYEVVWVVVMFDLPSKTALEKKAHAAFRGQLLRRGYSMLQWSVYARCYPNEKGARPHAAQIEQIVPRGGRVRLLLVTDKQFDKMTCIDGEARHRPERRTEALVLL